MNKEPVITLSELSKVYKLYDKPIDRLKETFSKKKVYYTEHKALDTINLNILKGEAVGIVGKNGSGKSTLLKILTGVLNETSGEKTIKGNIAAILELGAGFNPEYTGIDNVYLNGTMLGYSKEEMDQRIEGIISFADIGNFIYQPVKTYSSGMFARLAFAVAINVSPDILIVDEALAVGDTRFQIKCIEKMKQLKESGTTILFVSHATEQVKRFCNRAIWLENGVLKADGDASEIVDLYESYMKNGEVNIPVEQKADELIENVLPETFLRPSEDTLALIKYTKVNSDKFKTFDELKVSIVYDIYEEAIEGFLLGVAIYTPDREYIFGPNTHLEKINIPNSKGRHYVTYTIPELMLLGGEYVIDIGIFNNEGIVCLDYKADEHYFSVTNSYFSEGKIYMKHEWMVKDGNTII